MASRFNGYIMNDKKALIPKYAIVPIIFYCLAVPSYFLVRFLTEGRSFYDASFFLDEKILSIGIGKRGLRDDAGGRGEPAEGAGDG